MKGYFTVYLPTFSLLHVHWSIDDTTWDSIVSKAITDVYGDPALFLRVLKLHGNDWIQDQQLDVFGKTNHWIISIGDHLHGSTIKILLITCIEENGEISIFESEPIALPASVEMLMHHAPTFAREIRMLNTISHQDTRISS